MRPKTARLWARRTVGAALLAATAAGCNSVHKEPALGYLGKTSLRYYEDEATEIAYPVGVGVDSTEVLSGQEPRTVGDRRKDEVWDMTLTEALHCALKNNEIIRSRVRSRGAFGTLGFSSTALTNPDQIPSIYDPAIQETGVLFGGRGVEAALADFDATFTSSLVGGSNTALQNNAGPNGRPLSLTNDTLAFRSGIDKQFATGGTVSVFQNIDYLGTNQPNALFPSSVTSAAGVQFRQPLLAGGGVEYTRIAGPSNPNFGSITGVTQGVLIARINEDITLADFEISVRNLLKDVEDVYWNLYFAYRSYDTALTARNSALRSWREAQARLEIGGVQGFRPADEAQARDAYFSARAEVEAALNEIYVTEAELRRLLGMPPNDGRVIRPAEEPTTAKLDADWHASLCEALMFRTELRRQKWQIKSLELQLVAARSLTRPRLDLVTGYQVNGFGDELLGGEGGPSDGALDTQFGADHDGYSLGFEFSVPIGFRQAKLQVQNIELRLAKAREVLAAQELDVAHEVADAIQAIEFQYQSAETNFNRRNAAARRLQLFEEELQAGTVTLDEVLRAQASLAQAENAYFQNVVQYNQSLSYLHFVKGTLLERDNVQLEEGPWTPRAYEQALRRAWHRSHAFPNPLLETEPPPFAIPEESRNVVCPPGCPVTPTAAPTAPAPASGAPTPPAPSGVDGAGDAEPMDDAPDAMDAPTPADPAEPMPYDPATEGGVQFPRVAPSSDMDVSSRGGAWSPTASGTPGEEFKLPYRIAAPNTVPRRDYARVPGGSTLGVRPAAFEQDSHPAGAGSVQDARGYRSDNPFADDGE